MPKSKKAPVPAKETAPSVFKIEKGVPLPNKAAKPKDDCLYPLRQMEVGDSFIVNRVHNRTDANSISSSIRYHTKKLKIKHKFSVFKDTKSDLIRVWRRE
jgi:hypothetical protein